MKNDVPLKSQGIKKGSVIQVVKSVCKDTSAVKEWPKFTEREVQEIIWMYRTITPSNFHKASRPEFFKKVLERYPKIQNNLSAISILKDPVLLATLGNPDTVRRMAKENRDLIDASKFIVDTLNSKCVPSLNVGGDPGDDLDSSSSSDEPNMASTSGSHRRITSTQLAQALGQVFAGGTNSLANISQRNLGESGGQSVEGNSTASNSTQNRITSSMFLNALSDVLRSTRSNNEVRNVNETNRTENADNAETETTTRPTDETNARQQLLYVAELQTMRDMGLTDTELCLQALIVCNGDLETAINLVLSGRGII